MRSYFLYFWILALLITAQTVTAAPNRWGRYSYIASAAFTYRDFSGVQGTDFSVIRHGALDISGSLERGRLLYTFGIFFTPQIMLNNVQWQDASKGSYILDFKTPYLGVGARIKRFRVDLLAGVDIMSWSGTPQLNYEDSPNLVLALKLSHSIPSKRYRYLSFPISARIWSRSEKDLVFDKKPYENSTVSYGNGFDFMVGVSYELR